MKTKTSIKKYQKKLLRIVCLLMLIPTLAAAGTGEFVTPEKASAVASNLVELLNAGQIRPDITPAVIGKMDTIRRSGHIAAYLFHLKPHGHILLSANAGLDPVQSMSLTADFDPESHGYENTVLAQLQRKSHSFQKGWRFFQSVVPEQKQKIDYVEYLHNEFKKQRKQFNSEKPADEIHFLHADLDLINSTVYLQSDYFGDAVLTGAAENIGDLGAVFPKIDVEFYDDTGNLIGSDFTYLHGGVNAKLAASETYTNVIRPLDKGYFKVWSSIPYNNVDRFEVSFDWEEYSFVEARADLHFFNGPSFSRDYFGDLYINGDIENRSSNYVTYFTQVYFAVMNEAGRVINTDFTYVDGDSYNTGSVTTDTAIYPGQIWPFELYTVTEYRSFSSYETAFEWNEESIGAVEYTLTIQSGQGGTTSPPPGSYTYEEDTEPNVSAVPAENYRFDHWSGDISGHANPVSVLMNKDKSIKAHFVRQYTLSLTAGAGGTTVPAPGVHHYDDGKQISIEAIPDDFNVFSGWTGDITGSANPVAVQMNADKTLHADFEIIHAPLSVTGEWRRNRSLFQVEYIAVLKWAANPENQNLPIVGYRIYYLNNDGWNLVDELDSGTTEFWHRGLEQDAEARYAVVAVHQDGTEGQPAYVTVR